MAQRGFSVRTYMLAQLAGVVVLLLGGGLFIKHVLPGAPTDPPKILGVTALTAVAMVWAIWLGATCFRRLDEFHQTAGKFAWYWGGSMGLAASSVLFAFIGMGGLHWLAPGRFHVGGELFDAFTFGYMTATLPALAGFLAVRAWWQVTRR